MIVNAGCLQEEEKLKSVDLEILVISDGLWVRSAEDQYNERNKVAVKKTEVSKRYIQCPI